MNRFRRFVLAALVALALLGAGVADYPPGPSFNPQPDPPGKTAGAIVQGRPVAGVIINDSPALFPPSPAV